MTAMPTRKMPKTPEHRSIKCCGKCAFKPGSPERADGYGWIDLVEGWQNGDPFYCHESVPGHYQEVKDDRPRWRTCAGWEAHAKTNFVNALRPIGIDTSTNQVFLPEEEDPVEELLASLDA